MHDLKAFFERIVPQALPYEHNLTEGDANGHSHVWASLPGPSFTVPIENGRMTLGSGSRSSWSISTSARELGVQVSGEL